MSITANVGLPGSGKSYTTVANIILPALKNGRIVVTNIPMKDCESFPGKLIQFTNEEAKEAGFFNKLPKGCIFVLDEVWRIWPAGMTANKINEEHKAYFAEHRHLVNDKGESSEIVLVSQDLQQIAAFFRSLVETTFRTVKLEKVGAKNSFRVDVYSGAITGGSPPESKREKQLYGKYSKDVYKYYKSHTKSDGSAVGMEQRPDKRFKLIGPGKVIAYFVFLFILFFFGGRVAYDYFYPTVKEPQTEIVSTASDVIPIKANKIKHESSLFNSLKHVTYELITRTSDGLFVEVGFELHFKDRVLTVTDAFLKSNGLSFERLSECLYMVSLKGYEKLLTCPEHYYPDDKENFFTDVVTGE